MKKMKKVLVLALAGVMTLGLTACESSDTTEGGGESKASGDKKTIYIYQMKIEIDEALKEVTKKYTETHPDVEFVVESASDNYNTSLKTKFTGGEAPDIFTLTGYEDAKMWSSNLEDLSGEPWVENMVDQAKEGIVIDGKVCGFPTSVEGWGYMYNKKLFEQAGIKTLPTTMTELKEVCGKLSDAGIQPLTECYMDWYQAGMFMVNTGIARQEDPMGFINGLNDGTKTFVGDPIFTELANFLLYDVSQCESPMNTDFNTQMAQFTSESVGFTAGGNWNQPALDAVSEDIESGLMPFPINDDSETNDKLYVGIAGYWGVNTNSPVKEEAKDFLEWLATTEEGQSCMTKDLQLIPAFTNFSADAESIGDLGTDVSKYVQEGKTYGFYYSFYPDGFNQAAGEAVQRLVAGKASVDEFLQELQQQWDNLKK